MDITPTGNTRSIVVLGSESAGKTALISRYAEDTFTDVYEPTLESNYVLSTSHAGHPITLRIREIGGGGFSARSTAGVDGFLLVYGVDARPTFDAVKGLHATLAAAVGTPALIPRLLVATRSDTEASKRAVTSEEGAELARSWGCPYIETSAKTGANVSAAFSVIMAEISRLNAVGGGRLVSAGSWKTGDRKGGSRGRPTTAAASCCQRLTACLTAPFRSMVGGDGSRSGGMTSPREGGVASDLSPGLAGTGPDSAGQYGTTFTSPLAGGGIGIDGGVRGGGGSRGWGGDDAMAMQPSSFDLQRGLLGAAVGPGGSLPPEASMLMGMAGASSPPSMPMSSPVMSPRMGYASGMGYGGSGGMSESPYPMGSMGVGGFLPGGGTGGVGSYGGSTLPKRLSGRFPATSGEDVTSLGMLGTSPMMTGRNTVRGGATGGVPSPSRPSMHSGSGGGTVDIQLAPARPLHSTMFGVPLPNSATSSFGVGMASGGGAGGGMVAPHLLLGMPLSGASSTGAYSGPPSGAVTPRLASGGSGNGGMGGGLRMPSGGGGGGAGTGSSSGPGAGMMYPHPPMPAMAPHHLPNQPSPVLHPNPPPSGGEGATTPGLAMGSDGAMYFVPMGVQFVPAAGMLVSGPPAGTPYLQVSTPYVLPAPPPSTHAPQPPPTATPSAMHRSATWATTPAPAPAGVPNGLARGASLLTTPTHGHPRVRAVAGLLAVGAVDDGWKGGVNNFGGAVEGGVMEGGGAVAGPARPPAYSDHSYLAAHASATSPGVEDGSTGGTPHFEAAAGMLSGLGPDDHDGSGLTALPPPAMPLGAPGMDGMTMVGKAGGVKITPPSPARRGKGGSRRSTILAGTVGTATGVTAS